MTAHDPHAPPLWRPSSERQQNSLLSRFMATAQSVADRPIAHMPDLHQWSISNPEAFWQTLWSNSGIIATHPPERIITPNPVLYKTRFFAGATLNFAENLLKNPGAAPAIIARNEASRQHQTLSRQQLRDQVAAFTQALKSCGIKPGDRIAAIMPNSPETIIAVLAAASLGAVWSSCSPDFGLRALIDRFGQISPKILISCNGYHYAGKTIALEPRLNELLPELPSIRDLIIVDILERPGNVRPGVKAATNTTIHHFDALIDHHRGAAPEFIPLPFDHPLYIVYSSGTTGKPKCIIHGAGGALLTHIKEHRLHCDIRPHDRLFYFTTCGWMMWNWLISGLASEATLILYDGSPFHPTPTILFDDIDATGITHFGISAKFLDALRKSGARPKTTHKLNTLRTIMSTGSVLAPESFDFTFDAIKSDTHLISMSGGTDIMGCFVIGNPLQPVWRGDIQGPALGMDIAILDDQGQPTRDAGELTCRNAFPSLPLGFWNDPDDKAFHKAYFDHFPNIWRHGDFVQWRPRHDPDQLELVYPEMQILGRSDVTLNPSGVRIGPAEIYAAVEALDDVREAVVVGQDWQGDVRIVLFVVLSAGLELDADREALIRATIRTTLSPRHVPAKIIAVSDIPHTRSGKISETAVRETIHNRPLTNISALANPEALDQYRDLIALTD